jgi:hypothetical protein
MLKSQAQQIFLKFQICPAISVLRGIASPKLHPSRQSRGYLESLCEAARKQSTQAL